jgi:hypothetical protein
VIGSGPAATSQADVVAVAGCTATCKEPRARDIIKISRRKTLLIQPAAQVRKQMQLLDRPTRRVARGQQRLRETLNQRR